MAKLLVKSHFSGEEVLEENEGGMQDTFFPESDKKLGCEVSNDEDSEEER